VDPATDAALVVALRSAVDPLPQPPPPVVDPVSGLRNAAVLIVADPASPGVPLLFIRRSRHVSTHQGQIAFPGGGAEAVDGGPEGTALREASEEVGIQPGDVEVIGALPPTSTRTASIRVDPVVALARRTLHARPDDFEVDHVFFVGLDELLDAPVTARPIPGMEGAPLFFIEVGDRVIWGATAAMLVELLRRVRAALSSGGGGQR
jgi:8-oxo-dGTP pyrophosphatase MutT (NUDIX family)